MKIWKFILNWELQKINAEVRYSRWFCLSETYSPNTFDIYSYFISDTESSTGTCSVIEEMFPGDKITVTGDDKFPGVAVGDGHSEFTGYLVKKLDDWVIL